jgi:hypothetical protein
LDSGVPGNRTNAQVTGCPVQGRVSRWPISNGAITGPEEYVLGDGGSAGGSFCSQFQVSH